MPRLSLIDRPVKWENSGNEKIFAKALAEIKRYTADDLSAVFAPFAVTINKAMIELPAKFKDRLPVSRNAQGNEIYRGAEGLAADILHYGKLLFRRDESLLNSLGFEHLRGLFVLLDTVRRGVFAKTFAPA